MIDRETVETRFFELRAAKSTSEAYEFSATRRELHLAIQVLVEAINRELNDDKPQQENVLRCGHPAACMRKRRPMGTDEFTYPRMECGWCEDIARLTEAARAAERR
jgi:hypothetical protein